MEISREANLTIKELMVACPRMQKTTTNGRHNVSNPAMNLKGE